MKKIFAILAICMLLISMPVAMSMSKTIPQPKINKKVEPQSIPTTAPKEEPPDWANGNFSGVWGIDIWGEAQIPLGWMYGYYKRNVHFGYFYAAFAEFWEEEDYNYLQGFLIGPYMLGMLGENESANETAFVGIGGYDETNFYWRVMGLEGPTFFMYGEYTKFEE